MYVEMSKAAMRFNHIPARIMSLMLNFSLLKTMVFGGVATGNMNAQDAEMVTVNKTWAGLASNADSNEARSGKSRTVEEVLEVNSVKKVMNKARIMSKVKTGNDETN